MNKRELDELRCTERHVGSGGGVVPLTAEEAQRMGEFFTVLADATRLRLVSLLAGGSSAFATWRSGSP